MVPPPAFSPSVCTIPVPAPTPTLASAPLYLRWSDVANSRVCIQNRRVKDSISMLNKQKRKGPDPAPLDAECRE